MKKITSYFFLTFVLLGALFAQTPEYTFTNETTGNDFTTLNVGFWGDNRVQLLYPPGDFGDNVDTNGAITNVYLRVNNAQPLGSVFTNFEIRLAQSNVTELTADWETGLTTLFSRATLTVGPVSRDQWINFELEDHFPYDSSQSLIVDIRKTGATNAIILENGGEPVRAAYANNNTFGRGQPSTIAAPQFNPINSSLAFGFDLIEILPDNAGVLSVDSPLVFCAGTEDVYATIRNFGTNQLDSVDVNWEVNGVAQPTFSFKGKLDTIAGSGTRDTLLNLGSASFSAGNNEIKVYTSLPNGVADTLNDNDTIVFNISSSSPPTDITVSNILRTTVDVSASNFPGDLDYEFGLEGFSLYSGTRGASTTVPFTISGLTSGTTYDVYLRSNCGSNDTTDWVGPVTFTTAFDLPYEQDWETMTEGDESPFIEGWVATSSNGQNTNPIWEIQRANGNDREPGGGTAGPIWDHTTFGVTGGKLMLFNSWLAPFNSTEQAELVSPSVFITNAQEKVRVSYWYFMHGANIQSMEVIVDTNGVEDTVALYAGVQQIKQTEDWLYGEHYLEGYAGKSITVKFRGYSAQTGASMAIDDIRIDTLLDVSAGVTAAIEPSGALCAGAVTPVVAVTNSGKDDLTSFKVVSDINGSLDTVSVTRTLATGDSAHVTLSSFTFVAGVTYNLRYYTIEPNGVVDEYQDDDTLTLDPLNTGLEGIVTLDPALPISGSNFHTFRGLADRLNTTGVCGNVTVNVAAGTYDGDFLQLENVDGLSADSRLTIDGGSRGAVILRNTGNDWNAALSFDRTSYVTVKNMEIEGRFSAFQAEWGAFFTNESNYDSLVNILFDMDNATFNVYGIGGSANITSGFQTNGTANANFLTVLDCEIEGGDISVNFRGTNDVLNGYNTGHQYLSVKTYGWDNQAYQMFNTDSLIIDGDSIYGGRSNFFQQAISLTRAMNFRISNKTILTNDEGIRVFTANSVEDPQLNAEIYNNMISTDGRNDASAIYLRDPLRISMWYNSIYSAAEVQPAVNFDGIGLVDSLDVRNNIFFSTETPAFRMDGADDTLAFLRFDNNVFFRRTPGALLNVGGSDYNSLAAYQGVTPRFNVNSLNEDPQFASPTDLHIIGVVPNDGADNSVQVFVDVDGDQRPSVNALIADIGADEYDAPDCPPPTGTTAEIIRADSVVLSWVSNNVGVTVQYEYSEIGFNLGTGTRGSSATDTARLGGLNENTSYEVYVREICGRGDTSFWTGPILFETPCFPKTVGYFADFDNSQNQEIEPCWVEYGTDPLTNFGFFAKVQQINANAFSGNRALVLQSWFGNDPAIDTLLAIGPLFEGMTDGDKRIVFWAASQNTADALIIHTSNNNTGTNLTPIDTILFTTTDDYKRYYIDLTTANQYNGTDEYVVFEHSLNTVNQEIRLDDIIYEEIPSCLAPREPKIKFLGSDSVIVEWTDFAGATEWEIEYDEAPLVIGSGTRVSSTINPDTITGLLDNTDYEFVVRAVCAVGDTSLWTFPTSFTTECIPFTSGVFEDFDIYGNEVPDCWQEWKTYQLASAQCYAQVRGASSFSPSRSLELSSWFGFSTTGSDTLLITSPRYSDMTDGDKRIRFHANTNDLAHRLEIYTSNARGSGATYNSMGIISFNALNDFGGAQDYYTVDLTTANGYNGTDNYIAFSVVLDNSTPTFDEIRIDDYYYEDIPSCPRPENLTATPGTDTAIVSWTNTNTSDTTIIAYSLSPLDFETATYDTIFGQGSRDTIRNLVGGNFYQYAVKVICSPGDTSDWSRTVEFVTECVPYAAPYFTNLTNDLVAAPPTCWAEIATVQGFNAGALVQNFGGLPGADGKVLILNAWTANNANLDTIAAISPQFLGMSEGDKRLRFFANTNDITNDLFIYTLDGPTGSANYTVIDTISFDVVNDYKQYYVDLTTANGYNGTDSTIAFIHSLDGGFADQIRIDDFNYEEIPSCLAPRDAYVDVTGPDTTGLGWDVYGTETEWEIEYGTAPLDVGNGTRIIVTSNPAVLDGLTENTDYEYRVRAVCGVADTSFWTPVNEFSTTCFAIAAPYFNDFDADPTGENPQCWGEYFTYNVIDFAHPDVAFSNNGNVRSTPNALRINSWFNYVLGSDTMISVLPEFVGLTDSDKRLRFWSSIQNNTNSELFIWTGDNPDPSRATMHVIDTISYDVANVMTEVVVNFDNASLYNGTDEYIFFVHSLDQTNNPIFIDDFNYEEIPSCFRVEDIDHTNLNVDSTEFSWTDVNATAPPEYEIEYGPVGFVPGTGEGVVEVVTTNPAIIDGLTSSTFYDVYIRAICGAGDTSLRREYEFLSFCAPLPSGFETSFEDTPADSEPACWNEIINYPNGILNANNPSARVFENNAPRTGTKAIVMNSWNGATVNPDSLLIVTPQMDSITNGDHQVSVWMRSTNLNAGVIVATAPSLAGVFNPIDTLVNTATFTYEQFTVELTTANGYNGTDEHIVFSHDFGATFTTMWIDDMIYEKIPSCFPPLELNAQFIGQDSAFLAWNDTTAAAEWEYEYGTAGYTFGTGIRGIATDTSTVVNGLTASTTYDYYVRAICSVGDSSRWTRIPGTFTTRGCDITTPVGLPWTENWENVNDTSIFGNTVLSCDDSHEWLFLTSNQEFGRVRAGDSSVVAASANGKGITLDCDTVNPDVINSLILTLDLSDYSNYDDLVLSFSAMHHGEERDPNDSIWIRGFEGDPWVSLDNVLDVVNFAAFTRLEYDLDSLLEDRGQYVSSRFQLRFGQEDNFSAAAFNLDDGLSIDSISITGGQIVSVNEVEASLNNISIYPNPSTGLFTISIDSELKENYNVTVRDVKGQLVYEESVNVNGAYKKDLDFTDFAKGVYFMQVQSETNSYVEKLIIQ